MLHCSALHHPSVPRGLCIPFTYSCYYTSASSCYFTHQLVAGTCSPRVSSNTCSELPLQPRPLSWGSALQETARDLRGVNEPADIKLRSQAVLTPRCPFSPREAGVSRITLPCEPHFHASALPPPLQWHGRTSLSTPNCSHQEQKLRLVQRSPEGHISTRLYYSLHV